MALDAFQAEVARVALEVAGGHGFALAGANALVAHGIVERDTQDVDLFSDQAGGPGAATAPVRAALEAAGYEVEITRPPELNMGEFTRLIVRRGDDAVQVDMARDWRKWPPVRLDVGPVVHVEDAVSSKVTALVGRRAPRDFIDVAAAHDHGYSRGELMRLAFTRDPGLRVVDFTLAVRQLDQLTVEDFSEYGLGSEALDELRSRFADWPRHDADDHEGHAVQAAVAEEEQRAKTAEPETGVATLAGQAYPTGRTTPDAGQAAPPRRPRPAGEDPPNRQAPEGRHPRRSP